MPAGRDGALVSWRAPARSEAALAALAAAETDRAARPERYRLDPDDVTAAACRRDDDRVRFAEGWDEGLEQYLASAREDGRLHALGTAMVARTAIGRLRAGAAMSRWREAHPESADVELVPPIVITGGWRTGTTFLFRLLATDPRLRAPLPGELADPCGMAGLRGPERDAAIDAGAAAHDLLHMLNPQLQAIHDSGPRLPEECVLAMGSDLRNWGFTSTVRLDGYARWLADQGLAGSYDRYREVLQALDVGDGRRWVLKAPAHTAELRHLVATFPGAVVVQLHRDIVETIASGTSLFAVFRSTYSDEVDPGEVGAFQADQTELWFRRALQVRSGGGADGGDADGGAAASAASATFVDLSYRDLVRDPVAAITAVYAAADLDPPGDPTAFVAAYHDAHPRHAHGAHRYDAADFGLDEGELRERFAFLDGPTETDR
jgi:hypothetical protein